MNKSDLITYLDQLLKIHEIKDYGPQGVQVEASNTEIKKVAVTTDTAPNTIQAAADWGADMLFVHHGIFWGGSAPLRGALGQRVRMLIENDIHLYAAHLSLDAHPEYGNNAGMAQQLGLTDWEWFGMVNGIPLGIVGNLPKQLPLTDFTAQVDGLLNTSTRVLAEGNGMVRRVGILSGSGIKYMSDAATMGADTFLTGETDHSSYYMAADHGINVLFAGHYATETVGVQLIGHHLAERFGIEYKFFDFPTGM